MARTKISPYKNNKIQEVTIVAILKDYRATLLHWAAFSDAQNSLYLTKKELDYLSKWQQWSSLTTIGLSKKMLR